MAIRRRHGLLSLRPLSLTRIITPILCLSAATSSAQATDDLFGDDGDIMIASSSRMQQSPRNTAGSTTVITADMIRAAGITEIGEIFRLVPGYHIDETRYFRTLTSSPGEVGTVRTQWLINGKKDFASQTIITKTLTIEEIERVEVHHENSSASYGGRAFYGVVNFITKSPESTLGTQAKVIASNVDSHSLFVSHSGHIGERTLFNVNVKAFTDESAEGYRGRGMTEAVSPIDDEEKFHGSLTLESLIGDKGKLTFALRAVNTDIQGQVEYSPLPPYNNDNPPMYIQGRRLDLAYEHSFENHELEFSAYARRNDMDGAHEVCAPEILFGTPSFDNVCGYLRAGDYRQTDKGFSISDVAFISKNWRISSAIDISEVKGASPQFNYGEENLGSEDSKLHINSEYLWSDIATINLGFMAHSVDKQFKRPKLSPKAAFNWHITNGDVENTLRFIVSRGKETSHQGTSWDLTFLLDTFDGERLYGLAAPGGPELDKDHRQVITSRAISWYMKHSYVFESDIRIFHDDINDIIKHNYENLLGNNEGLVLLSVEREGAEFTATYTGPITVRASGHYIEYDGEYDVFNYWHGGSLMVGKQWNERWQSAVTYYGHGDTTFFSGQDKVDFNVLYKPTPKQTYGMILRHQRERTVDANAFINGGQRSKISEENELRFTFEMEF